LKPSVWYRYPEVTSKEYSKKSTWKKKKGPATIKLKKVYAVMGEGAARERCRICFPKKTPKSLGKEPKKEKRDL